MSTAISRETEQNGIKNLNDIVRKRLWIPKKQKEVQEERIKYFKKRGDQQFTRDGRGAEITIDWVFAGPC